MDTQSLETAGKTIPTVLLAALLFKEVASIFAVNDTSSHHSDYSHNYTTKITAVILILLSALFFKKTFDEERTV